MTQRVLVSIEQLVDILNRELAKYSECEGVSVSYPPDRLETVDETGCNWSQVVILRGSSGTQEACSQTAAMIIGRAAAQYNVLWA